MFLDEFPEFGRGAIEVLRQPLEEHTVTIARAAGTFTYPARFQLVASMNPCPCGYRGVRNAECRCDDAEPSAAIRGRVVAARTIAHDRFAGTAITANAEIPPSAMRTYCSLDDPAMKLLALASTKRQFSARALDRIARVARTIADLAASESIRAEHVAETVQYRSLERLDGRAA